MYAIIILILTLFAIFLFLYSKKNYEETEYHKQTGNSYFSILFDKGAGGEYSLSETLNLIKIPKRTLFNLYIPFGGEQTSEVDCIVLHSTGIYVFEVKNYGGWIFGSDNQRYWTQTLPATNHSSEKHKFYNPIWQNSGHIRRLKEYLQIKNLPIFSYIVFSDRCVFKKINFSNTNIKLLYFKNVPEVLCNDFKCRPPVINESVLESIYNKLYPLTQTSENVKNTHVKNIQVHHHSINVKYCPLCGNKLVLRTAKKGPNAGNKFWGCSNYPNCRYVEKYIKK